MSKEISKWLSYVLRHKPSEIGLELSEGAWADDRIVLAALAEKFSLDAKGLEQLVASNDKQRFEWDRANRRIRARQGHSVTVAVERTAVTPPDVLYHGTVQKFLSSIFEQGLIKKERHHVHLSATIDTAKIVGQRRGTPIILEVDSAAMYKDGYVFYCTENQVWLTDTVPVAYLRQMDLL